MCIYIIKKHIPFFFFTRDIQTNPNSLSWKGKALKTNPKTE